MARASMTRELKEMIAQCESTARLLKELAHPLRLELLCHLAGGEKTVSDLTQLSDASQSRISQFLGRMRSEGLVAARRDGNFVHYRIDDPKILGLMQALQRIFCV